MSLGPYRSKGDSEEVSEEERLDQKTRAADEKAKAAGERFKQEAKIARVKFKKQIKDKKDEKDKAREIWDTVSAANDKKTSSFKEKKKWFKIWRAVFLKLVISGETIEKANSQAKEASTLVMKQDPKSPKLELAGILDPYYIHMFGCPQPTVNSLMAVWAKKWCKKSHYIEFCTKSEAVRFITTKRCIAYQNPE